MRQLLPEFCGAKLHAWMQVWPLCGYCVPRKGLEGRMAIAGGHAVPAQRAGTEPPQSPVFCGLAAKNAPKLLKNYLFHFFFDWCIMKYAQTF
jgi:hypothetical protein